MLGCVTVFAQKIDKNELRQLQAFMAEPAEKDATNAQALKITDLKSPATWEGVTVENGHVTAIDWKDKHLAGSLDLSGFKALTKVDVSRNKLASLSVENDAALADLNASRNQLRKANLDGCSGLVTLNIYKNRLTELDITATPLIETVNISNNLLVDLDVSNSSTLKTLNCQGNPS